MPPTKDYGRHEVLHMVEFLGRTIDNELVNHKAIKAVPAWLELAEHASDALAELYQAIGAVHFAKERAEHDERTAPSVSRAIGGSEV